MKELVLRNGISIPQIGLGTWQITDREKVKEIVGAAYDEGYRLIDTAAAYTNEMAIGKAIQSLELSREELIAHYAENNTYSSYFSLTVHFLM